MFKITKVIGGDAFEVTPYWKFKDVAGNRVRIASLEEPELNTAAGKIATEKLRKRVLNRNVKLKGKAFSYGRLVADYELI